ncbi:Fungal trans [Geosmithia morbida]|uniref:Fungal trans n=1 Tax=Geosmithia morbida TaxID=1094350 RepID=A0A9P5CZM1_9HYPO|nr:Fungal trans [Geosmithia morbida]KAF4120662.1 Fungal trans [Geosmithia morbida]
MSTSAGAPPSTASTAQRSQRVLACVLCQHRKIKCDRNTPCSNCLKANVTCTPSTPAPARKRRRPNQDLQERLARCEALLKQYAGGAPLTASSTGPSSAQGYGSGPTPSPAQTPMTAHTPGPSPAEPHTHWLDSKCRVYDAFSPGSCLAEPMGKPPAGKMIESEGGARFVDNRLWTSFYDELQAMRQIVDTEDPDESSTFGTEAPTPDHANDLILPGSSTPTSVEDFYPDAVHTFRLWQIFLERVNPLTKLIHVPTLQPYIVEATTNPAGVALQYQALLFSIYLMATTSLNETECAQVLNMPRAEAIKKFTGATRNALLRFDYLRNYDMASLQALVLFLVSIHMQQQHGLVRSSALHPRVAPPPHSSPFSPTPLPPLPPSSTFTDMLAYSTCPPPTQLSLQGRYDRHAAWVLSGTVVRIAQKMGYHRDGELLHLTPFETEMRRRLWWQILFQDTKLAVVSGLSHNFMRGPFDTKQPQNLNDADLLPGSTEPVVSREGPTEMSFVLMINRVGTFMVSDNSRSGFEAAIVAQGSATEGQGTDARSSEAEDTALLDHFRTVVDELDHDLREIERRFIDPTAGGVHAAAKTLRIMLTEKMMGMLTPAREQPEWGTEIFTPKDNFFKIVLMNNEHSVDSYEVMNELGFLWIVLMHFQLDAFSVLTGQLVHHPTGSLSDRGWKVVEKIYKWQPELYDMSVKVHLDQAQFTLKAWKAREQAFAKMGLATETPQAIIKLRECLPSYDSRSSTATSATPPPVTTHMAPPSTDYDPFLGGLDNNSYGWEMWDMMPGATTNNQLSAAFFGGFNMMTEPE